MMKFAKQLPDLSFLRDKLPQADSLQQHSDYIDFKELGYSGDPIIYGGRFKALSLGRVDNADGR